MLKSAAMKSMAPLWKGGSGGAVQDYHQASDEEKQLSFLSSRCVSLFSCEGGNALLSSNCVDRDWILRSYW